MSELDGLMRMARVIAAARDVYEFLPVDENSPFRFLIEDLGAALAEYDRGSE